MGAGLPQTSLATGSPVTDREQSAAFMDDQLDVPLLNALVADARAAILAARKVRIARWNTWSSRTLATAGFEVKIYEVESMTRRPQVGLFAAPSRFANGTFLEPSDTDCILLLEGHVFGVAFKRRCRDASTGRVNLPSNNEHCRSECVVFVVDCSGMRCGPVYRGL